MLLDEYLSINLFHLLLVFSRLGTVFMFIPGISAPYVSVISRVGLAMAISAIVVPMLSPQLPALPATGGELFLLIAMEVTMGMFLGALIQAWMSALHFAGTVISFNSGMANAMVFDPITAQQGAMVTGFLGNIAVLLIFATDMHHLMLRAILESYTLVLPGEAPPVGDFSKLLTEVVGQACLIGVQLSAPFIAFTMVFYTGLGLLNKLSPQMNVFFVGLPIQLLISLALLAATLPVIMMWFLRFLEDGLQGILTSGFG